MSQKMGQKLSPHYPLNFIGAGFIVIGIFVASTALFFIRFGFEVTAAAVITSALAAVIGLYCTNGNSWSRGLIVFGSVLVVGNLIDHFFENIRSDAFEVVYHQARYWINALFLLLAVTAFYRWQLRFNSSMTANPVMHPWLDRLTNVIDLRANSRTGTGKTGYLMTPKFIAERSVASKPTWWWLQFGVVDPAVVRTAYIWVLIIPIWMLFGAESIAPAAQFFMIVAMVVSAEQLYQFRRTQLRRLYLQSPGLSRAQFMFESGKLHCLRCLKRMALALMVLAVCKILWTAEIFMNTATIGVIGFSLLTSSTLVLNMLQIKINLFIEAMQGISAMTVSAWLYWWLYQGYIEQEWLLVAGGFLAFFGMVGLFKLWSRSDIAM